MKTKRYGSGESFSRIYLIAPKHPDNFWDMRGLVAIFNAKSLMPNSALATLMALTPPNINIEYILADENVSTIDFSMECDLVALTGSTLHARRIHEICAAFKARGIPVALGGSYASVESKKCAGIADYHFIGEAEYTWPRFLADWNNGSAQKLYKQTTPIDLHDSPAPDFSLIRPDDYINITIQTSRGCPNNCDFCEVIQYLGRQYRTKSIEQIMREVKNAHATGARSIFFSDDNFMGNKKFTKELVSALITWNISQSRPLSFSTQITLQVANDIELLQMLADARFSVLFLGVESVREKSLKEVNKGQNFQHDIYEQIKRISHFGMVPFLGLIVGFDNDDELIFDDLFDFISGTASPIAGISLLNAPDQTPLFKRLQKEKRLIANDYSGEYQLFTNIIPKQMSRETLISKYKELFHRIYNARNFESRLLAWLEQIEYISTLYTNKKMDWKQLKNGFHLFTHYIFKAKKEERSLFFRNIKKAWKINPKLMKRYFTLFAQYSHFYKFIHKTLK